MANTTFKGTLRSEGGYSSIATTSGTGAETTQMSISSAGFTSLDANTMATEAGTGITGGTGTFGQAFVLKLLKYFEPKKIIILSRDEFKQYEMEKKFKSLGSEKLRFFLGDVRDVQRLKIAFTIKLTIAAWTGIFIFFSE